MGVGVGVPGVVRARTVWVLDLLLLVWIAGWIVYGLAVDRQIENLTSLSDTLVTTGRAVDATGAALQPLERIPFVGQQIGQVAAQIRSVGVNAERSGAVARQSTHDLAIELGWAVVLIPTVPFVLIYVPMRVSRIREARSVRRAARRYGSDTPFREFLARRATERLSYTKLRAISERPWEDVEQGRFDALASAELRRLGLRWRAGAGSIGDGARGNT